MNNSRKLILPLVLILLLAGTISANPLARIYQADDPLLGMIEAISIESKVNPFSATGLISGYELHRHLESIDTTKLSSLSKDVYDSVKKHLLDPFDAKIWDYSVRITQEGYVQANPAFRYFDWAEHYTDREPLLYGDAETVFGDHAYGIFSYSLQKAFRESDFTGFKTNNPLFLHGGNTAVQNSVPHTAFIGFSGPWYTLAAGRDALRFGRGSTGNLMIGDHVPYHDFVQISLSNKKIKYSFLALPMNELVTQQMLDSDILDPTISNLGEAWYPHLNPAGAWHTLFFGTRRRTFLSHRLEVDFLPWWRVAVTEGTMIYTDHTDIRMFSPLMFLHNLQNFGEVNNTLGLETEITVSNHWALDLQVFLDQLQTKGEQSTSEPIPPNAYALLLGGRYRYPLKDWTISGFIEGVYTSPFAYLRTGDNTHNYSTDPTHENTQFNLDLVHAVNMEEGKSGVHWLGYVYGPDSIVLATELNGTYKNLFTLSSSLRFIVQGERGLHIEGKKQKVELQLAEHINMLAPSGDNPMHTLVAGLGFSMQIPKSNASVFVRNYWLNRWDNSGHDADYQLIFGASYEF